MNGVRLLAAVTRTTFALLLSYLFSVALAAPGAHGPSGEHLDQSGAAVASTKLPRVEAKSESFELVGTLYDSELSILVDRYETNEPVFGASLEVESGGIKAVAKFHADHGDYAADDPKLLELLAKPGEHALVFTLVAGKESDLLDGTLVTPAAAVDDHDHGAFAPAMRRAAWIGVGGLVVAALGAIAWRRRRQRSPTPFREVRP
jgi:hypothetical protein